LFKEPSVEPEWVDYPTAERFSSLSHTTLWRCVGSGELKAARVGRSVRIHLPTLKAFMEERSAGDEKQGSSSSVPPRY
jgi:excisionase family DNA binding protein